MVHCNECDTPVTRDKVIICGGTCGHTFHQTCVLSKTQIAAWSARVGLVWLCASCRLNFNPAVHDRHLTIMKALRELLIRMDSMDTRLGTFGESLRKVNKTLFSSKPPPERTFTDSINQLNLDDSTDLLERSRSCEETSFFEVIDEINTTIAQVPERIVVGGKHVQINPQATSSAIKSTVNLHRIPNASYPAPEKATTTTKTAAAAASASAAATSAATSAEAAGTATTTTSTQNAPGNKTVASRLKVATREKATVDEKSFYVTPFSPDQTEDDIKLHICDVSNLEPFQVKVVKLVPRGRSHDDLTFVSFKFTVPNNAAETAGVDWYWPEGITVRPFETSSKNGSQVRLPKSPQIQTTSNRQQ